MDVRLHETVSISGLDGSARAVLDAPMPPFERAYEQMVWLSALHKTLAVLLTSGNICDNPYFYEPGADRPTRGWLALRRALLALGRLSLARAEALGAADDASRVPGWNRLMLVWLVQGQLAACLDKLHQAKHHPDDEDDACRVSLLFLARNELLTTPGGVRDVPDMSMCELRRAVDLLRDRLFLIDQAEPPLLAYIGALERRAAAFACNPRIAAADFDVPEWTALDTARGDRPVVTRSYIATMAWHFVWLRRHVWAAMEVSNPATYQTPQQRGRIVTLMRPEAMLAAAPRAQYPARRRAVQRFVAEFARTMNTEDHQREFSLVASEYNVAPGDLDAHSHVHGMSGVERATVRDVVARRRCPAATTYVARGKWLRDMHEWLVSNTNGMGGAASEAWLEQLAVLHVVNAFMVSRLGVKWTKWFVITHRGAGQHMMLRVQQAVRNGLPFLVQRLGQWACLVPALPPRPGPTVRGIEVATQLFGDTDEDEDDVRAGDTDAACSVYECHDAYGAVAVWATFLLAGWKGRIHHSGRVLAPVLRAMLGIQ